MSFQSFKGITIREGRHTLWELEESLPIRDARLWKSMFQWLETLDGVYCKPQRLERIGEYHAFVERALKDKQTYLSLDPSLEERKNFLSDRRLAIGHLTIQQLLLVFLDFY